MTNPTTPELPEALQTLVADLAATLSEDDRALASSVSEKIADKGEWLRLAPIVAALDLITLARASRVLRGLSPEAARLIKKTISGGTHYRAAVMPIILIAMEQKLVREIRSGSASTNTVCFDRKAS